jgi:hypothetical protein
LRKSRRFERIGNFCAGLLGINRNAERAKSWRNFLRTYEIAHTRGIADELFMRSFGQMPPEEPRHFILIYFPPVGADDAQPCVVAYAHHRAFDEVYLGGGMCVDERKYRRFPKWLFNAVKAEGGLATIVSRESIGMLGDSPACFGHDRT